jgi:hypothetical protein
MPLLGTRGAASAKGFGFTAGASVANSIAISLFLTGKKLYVASVGANDTGDIYVAARQDDGVDGSDQFAYLLKFSSAGVLTWQKQIYWTNGPKFAYRTFMFNQALQVGVSGNIYVCFTQALDTNPFPYTGFVVKFDPTGTVLWQQSYNHSTTNNMSVVSIAINAAETALYAGALANPAAGNDFSYMVSLNPSSGAINWATNYAGQYGWYSLAIQSNGNVVGAGNISSGGYTGVAFSQFNSSGTLQWQKTYLNSLGNVSSTGIAGDSSNNIYVGYSYPSGGGGMLKVDNSGTYVTDARAFNNSPSIFASTSTGDLYGWVYDSASVIAVSKWNSSLAGQWANQITGVTPASIRAQGFSLGSSSNTTFFYGATIPGDGTNFGGIVYQLKRDGTGTGGGNKTAGSFVTSYSTGTSNILSQFGFTLANNTGTNEVNRFTTSPGYTLTISNSSITTAAVSL